MAKDKGAKAAAAKPAKSVDVVKKGRVEKPANSAKNVAKETAKSAAKNVEKSSKKSKKVKEPTPEPSSDEEEEDDEDTSDSSASSDSEDDEEEKPAAKRAAAAAAAAAAEDSDSDDSDSSDDDDEEEEKPKTNGHAKTNGAAAKDDDDEDMDDEDDSSDSSDDDEEDEDEEEEEKAAPAAGNKRKAEDSAAPSAKKTKYTIKGEEKEATANLFVGSLSWNVDDDWLAREFSECEGFGSARVMTERDSGRSRGFGYVEFDTPENAGAALEKLQGQEVDGRALNLDFSTPRTNNNSTPQQKSFDRAKSYGDVPKEPSNTLWVGNLSFDISQDVLSEYFAEHGTINSVRLPTDKETGEFKGFGYVEMASVEEAQAAFDALQGADVAGRAMRLDFAGPRPERQDSFGGGRGGGRGRGGFGNSRGGRGGFGGGRGGDRGRGGRGGGRGGRGGSTNRGGFGDFR